VALSGFRLVPAGEVTFLGGTPSDVMLAGGGSTQIILQYAAATPHPAGPLAVLQFDTPTQTQNVAINGEALIGSIGTNPATVEFGPVCAGPPVSRNVMIYANAPGTVLVQSLTPPAAPFSVPNMQGQLMGGHGNELMAVATLTPSTPGPFSDRLVINSDVPNQGMHEVPLQALVLADGVRPAPEVVHFGPQMTGLTTLAKEVVLSNCSSGPLMVMGAMISGADAADFAIVGPAMIQRELAAAASMTFLIVMSPKSNGPKNAQLVIAHAQGTTTADLDGDGYGGSAQDDDKERETYYACSAGGGAAPAWPIAFAFGLLALRRRRR
jgi:uncharacterized protein (TIGR03382 family)